MMNSQAGTHVIERIKLDRFDLRTKLIIAFGLVALLVAVTGAIGYTSVTIVDREAKDIASDGQEMDAATGLVVAIEQQNSAVQAAQLGDVTAQQRFEDANQRFAEQAQHLKQAELDSRQQEQFSTLMSQHEEYTALATEFFKAQEAGNEELAIEKAGAMQSLLPPMKKQATGLEESSRGDLNAQVEMADSMTQAAQVGLFALTVTAFGFAVGIGLFVARRMTTPIEQLSEASQAMSNGDLTVEVDDHIEDDELGRMSDSFQEMQSNLCDVFEAINIVSTELAIGDKALQTRDRQTEFPGTYGEILSNLDDGAEELAGSFDEIQSASYYLKTGRLNQGINTDRPGIYGEILADLDDGMEALSGSLDEIATASENLKDGRLDQTLDSEYPGTYGIMLGNLNDGIDQLSASIASVQQIADDVAQSSQQTTASVEETETASEEIATSIEEISAGAETQTESLEEVTGEMNDMSATVEEIASSAEEVAATASTAVNRSEAGRDSASGAFRELDSIKSQADESADQVQQLNAKMDEIGEVVELISEIAEQTNMLALNASIEAARAGDAGEGFGVVADEIKGLAEEAADATTTIEDRIEEVQEVTDSTVDEIEGMQATVESGTATIEDAVEMFDEIAAAVEEAESGIREISTSTDDQAASSAEVVSMIDEVASVSQQTATEAGNVSAAAEEQTVSLSEATESLQELSTLANELNDQTAAFEVGATGGPARMSSTGSRSPAVGDGGAPTGDRGSEAGQ